MFPVLLIAIGVAVLVFGKRLSVLGAAVGAILGAAILNLLQGNTSLLISLLIVGGLAALGFFGATFAKGIVNIVLLVFGAIAGAAIAIILLDLFNLDALWLNFLVALAGGVVGLILIQRFSDWGMIILSGLIGALLIVRGLAIWFPTLDGTLGTLVVTALAAVAIIYQGGFLNRGKSGPKTTA
jgi:hypothetical protein